MFLIRGRGVIVSCGSKIFSLLSRGLLWTICSMYSKMKKAGICIDVRLNRVMIHKIFHWDLRRYLKPIEFIIRIFCLHSLDIMYTVWARNSFIRKIILPKKKKGFFPGVIPKWWYKIFLFIPSPFRRLRIVFIKFVNL